MWWAKGRSTQANLAIGKERAGLRGVAHLLRPLRLARTLLALAHDDVFSPTRNADRETITISRCFFETQQIV